MRSTTRAYKQEEGVTYHARDMAVVRGNLSGFPVVLSSATPSVESRVNADRGRYRHILLPARYGVALKPEIAGDRPQRHPPERQRWLSPPLVAAVAEAVARGEQALLFLNRRGYAPLTLCRTCGHRFACPNCSAWLVEHRFRRLLVCHHCGHEERRPDVCPNCDAEESLVACGPGVERLQEEVLERFPEARTLVMSSDMPGGVERLRAELNAIAAGEVDIVIGTQLVAKGHNFPGLALVGVVDADLGLAHGDPRAAERTWQLLTQVTGRAGPLRPGEPRTDPDLRAGPSGHPGARLRRPRGVLRHRDREPPARGAAAVRSARLHHRQRRRPADGRGACARHGEGRAAAGRRAAARAGGGALRGAARPPPLPSAGAIRKSRNAARLAARLARQGPEGARQRQGRRSISTR